MTRTVSRWERARALFFAVLMVLSVFAVVPITGPVAATNHADVEFQSFSVLVDQPSAGDLDISWKLHGSETDLVDHVQLRFLDDTGNLVQAQHGEFMVSEGGGSDVTVANILEVNFVYETKGSHYQNVADV